MHYDPRSEKPDLPHDPFNALVVPRPIGWISSINANGTVNLAPYSFFNIVANKPPYVMFSSAHRKDSQRNVEERGEFVASMATYELRDQVNLSSAPYGADLSEPELLDIEMAASKYVLPPRVQMSPTALECRYVRTIELPGSNGAPHFCSIIIGEVVGIYIDERVLTNGQVDLAKVRPITRLGYMEYAVVDRVFEMGRPRQVVVPEGGHA
ncbi:MAG TPA: flavin reductase family protein [Burkholderiaceae bacterium]|nr:flavin reductase family protein [Burkholderiaceae bacterium]